SAARMHAVEWGTNVTNRVMIAFGGAAPLHAARLAQKLDIDTVVIPRGAGVGSAIGFLRAPVAYEVVRSRYAQLDTLAPGVLDSLFGEMRDEATALVHAAAPGAPLTERRLAYMRYMGQGHEIPVELTDRFDTDGLRRAFESAYEALFSRTIPGLGIEVLSWTLSLSAPSLALDWQSDTPSPTSGAARGNRQLFDSETRRWTATPVYRRDEVGAEPIAGPALIEEPQTTSVVPHGFSVTAGASGHLIIRKGASA
ncbi:MAG: hydantoinase/oxoprolinase family protein, partial [Chromatiales bacterium]|nr:hydantoinase/oxoprolinase family protein [Chromatiales bacterium]